MNSDQMEEFTSSYFGKFSSTFPLRRIVNKTTLHRYWLQACDLLFKEYAGSG